MLNLTKLQIALIALIIVSISVDVTAAFLHIKYPPTYRTAGGPFAVIGLLEVVRIPLLFVILLIGIRQIFDGLSHMKDRIIGKDNSTAMKSGVAGLMIGIFSLFQVATFQPARLSVSEDTTLYLEKWLSENSQSIDAFLPAELSDDFKDAWADSSQSPRNMAIFAGTKLSYLHDIFLPLRLRAVSGEASKYAIDIERYLHNALSPFGLRAVNSESIRYIISIEQTTWRELADARWIRRSGGSAVQESNVRLPIYEVTVFDNNEQSKSKLNMDGTYPSGAILAQNILESDIDVRTWERENARIDNIKLFSWFGMMDN